MIDFDQDASWRSVQERLDVTTNPRHRVLLETVLAHIRAEMAQDLDALMETLSDEPVYHFWSSSGKNWGPKGRDGVRNFYAKLVESGTAMLSAPKHRIAVDDDLIVTEGVTTTLAPGRFARSRGYDIDDESAHYLLRHRSLILWPFDAQGKLIGEDSYNTTSPRDFEKVAKEDLPPTYVAYLSSVGIAV